jgi:hypothetical protein
MEIVILVLVFLGFIALIVLLFRWVINQNKKKVLLYTAFAQKHGLQLETKKYLTAKLNDMLGEIDGYTISITEKMVGHGKNQQVWTTLNIAPSPFDFEFKIGKEHLFSKLGKGLGFKDVEVGDEKFDKRFLLKSKEPDKLKMLVDYNIQSELKAIDKDLRASIYGKSNSVEYSFTPPLMKQPQFDSFEKVMMLMIKLCEKSKGGRSTSTTNY